MNSRRSRVAGNRARFSPIAAIGVTQVLIWSYSASMFLPSPVAAEVTDSSTDWPAAAFALTVALIALVGSAGYAVIQSGHKERIQRTALACGSYMVVLAVSGAGLLALASGWAGIAPSLAVGVLLAIVLRDASSARNWLRFAIPGLAGGFVVSLRQVAETIWVIPTPDWTLTIIASLILGLYGVARLESSNWYPLRAPELERDRAE